MTQPSKAATPIWAWFVLIIGAIFSVTMAPVFLILILLPFFRPEETSIVSILFTIFAFAMLTAAIWGMAKAYQTIKFHRKAQKEQAVLLDKDEQTFGSSDRGQVVTTKPLLWPWVVIVPGAALIVMSGPGALMFPIMPIFLAGMSTDSGQTPDYVPMLIILIGYGLMIGYTVLVIMAVKTLRSGRQKTGVKRGS